MINSNYLAMNNLYAVQPVALVDLSGNYYGMVNLMASLGDVNTYGGATSDFNGKVRENSLTEHDHSSTTIEHDAKA